MSRPINPEVFEGNFFLMRTPLWQWKINDYAAVMILWNGFLAVVPVYAGYWLARFIRQKRQWWQTSLLGVFWILFTPNAAYLMADVRHIIGYCPVGEYGNVCPANAWMSVFFLAYGLLGWVSLVLSVRPVRLAVIARWGMKIGNIMTAVTLPLIALGFLLGLVNRWNSWDVISDLSAIINSALRYATDLTYFKNWLIVSVLFSLLYFAGERLFKTFAWEK